MFDLSELERGNRRARPDIVGKVAAELGVTSRELTPAPLTDTADDVERLLRALPYPVQGQIALADYGIRFADCTHCDTTQGAANARITITWEQADTTDATVASVCPDCLFAAVDRIRGEADEDRPITVEYTLVSARRAVRRAAA